MADKEKMYRIVPEDDKYTILYNTVLYCMMDNDMPLEILDKVYEDMQEGYRRDSIIK